MRRGARHALWAASVVAVCAAAHGQGASSKAPSLHLERLGEAYVFVARGLPQASLDEWASRSGAAAWREVFEIRVRQDGGQDVPGLLGTYSVVDGDVVFTPKYPLSDKVAFDVRLNPHALGLALDPVGAVLRVPEAGQEESTQVLRIFPSTDLLPANQLKFYVHFSAPMGRGRGYEYIRLLRSDGSEVEAPFPEIDVELWDGRQERLTVLLDPGRIKRGIGINEEMGLALVPGKTYRLVVGRDWPDAQGKPLAADFEKTFAVTEPDYVSPNVSQWEVAAPEAGSAGPLRVTFDEALDHGLLNRVVWVEDAAGREVKGEIALLEDETQWAFTPERAWKAGSYAIRADTRLEDLAGNHLDKPFEVDLLEERRPVESKVVTLPFEIR